MFLSVYVVWVVGIKLCYHHFTMRAGDLQSVFVCFCLCVFARGLGAGIKLWYHHFTMCAGDLQSSEEEAVVSQNVPEVVRDIDRSSGGHSSDTTTANEGARTWFGGQE